MGWYVVEIEERGRCRIAIEAGTADEAEAIAEDMYENGDVDMTRYSSASFDVSCDDVSEEEAIAMADMKEGQR